MQGILAQARLNVVYSPIIVAGLPHKIIKNIPGTMYFFFTPTLETSEGLLTITKIKDNTKTDYWTWPYQLAGIASFDI